jgi:hypothetical protein
MTGKPSIHIYETRPLCRIIKAGPTLTTYRIRETRVWYRISLGSIHPAMAIPEPVQYTVYLQARLNATCVWRLIQWIFQRTRVCVFNLVVAAQSTRRFNPMATSRYHATLSERRDSSQFPAAAVAVGIPAI